MQTSNLGLNSKCAWGCITCQVCVCVYVVCSCVCVRVKGCVVCGLHMHALTRMHICVYICVHRTIVLGNTAEDSVQRYFPSTCCSACCSVFQCVWRSRVYVLMKRDYQRDQYTKQTLQMKRIYEKIPIHENRRTHETRTIYDFKWLHMKSWGGRKTTPAQR